jgi:peroxiredoxin Q/BCP
MMQVRSWFSGLFLALVAFSIAGLANAAEHELKVGDEAPKFECIDDNGKVWTSTDHVGKHVVVVYFYPADLTGGCTKQACGYRDDSAKLKELGVEVVGVSGDSVENHQIFKKEHKLNFTLLADDTGDVANAFGVPVTLGPKVAKVKADGKDIELTRSATAKRWTFVIGKDGKIIAKNSEVKAAEDSKSILKLLGETPAEKKS